MVDDPQTPPANPGPKPRPTIAAGAEVIAAYVRTLPEGPGVYRMLDPKGNALYVGKAKSLKKRVTNYTHVHRLDARLRRMVQLTASMEFVTTHTEVEALLLESNLIKKLKPDRKSTRLNSSH